MAEFRKLPTQAELQNMLFMEQMRVKTPQQIAQEALASGTTVTPIPENVFQKIAGGAGIAKEYVNRAGSAADLAKLFPGYKPETKVTIPTGYNFAPKQAPTGEVIPGGLQTQNVNLGQVLQAIKPADVLGISGAERAYSDIGAGKAPQPLDVLDVAGLGATGLVGGKAALRATKGVPVGMSIQEAKGLLTEAPRSPLGFYSALEESALNLQRNKGSGQAFLNDLQKAPNVKADEIKWTGLDEFLKTKPNVTKQEVQDYLANNRVDVQEVQLGGAQPYNAQRLSQLESEYKTLKQHPIDDPSFGEEKYNELIRLANIRDQSTTQTLYESAERAMQNAQRAQRQGNNLTAEKYFREAEFFNTRAEKLDLEGQGMSNPPKFGQYTLPGGENYREILLTMPNIKGVGLTAEEAERLNILVDKRVGSSLAGLNDAEQKEYFSLIKKREQSASGYKSTHFDQPNILAHLRVNDRVDADGKKMLLVEEVQSDWHQAGREKGYKNIEKQRAFDAALEEAKQYSQQLREKYGDANAVSTIATVEEQNKYRDLFAKAQQLKPKSEIPDAPFKDSWYQLALKRAIQYAAENGYDRIGLTTGSQQAARFDLSKQISELHYSGTNLVAYDKAGNQVIQQTGVAEADLPGLIGKEAAKKLMEQPKQGTLRSLVGQELQVGGEGMKKYYDEIYPKFLDKYGKKWGARVGETKIQTRSAKEAQEDAGLLAELGVSPDKISTGTMERIRYLDVTPEMKASVSKGQPLFQALPAIPATGLLATQDEER